MILEDIEAKLQELQYTVFYGLAGDTTPDGKEMTEWNYIVFMRNAISMGTNKRELSDHYTVAVVHEDYIPDGLAESVIAKMQEIPGMRVSNNIRFAYTSKPNTNTIVEVLTIEFIRARKVA